MNEQELKATIGEAAFKAMSAEQVKATLDKFQKPAPKEEPKPEPKDDKKEKHEETLRDKASKEKQTEDEKKAEMAGIEKALTFNLTAQDFVKQNADLLPNDIGEILKIADKEKYDTAMQKAKAVKTAFIQSFFSVQSNVELLTAHQKSALDDYLKLTKNGKEDKAVFIFENIFEPAFETLKKVKKAEELGKSRSGLAASSKVEDGYKARLMASSRKTHLNEKGEK